jgi:hypothetical protein
MAIKYINIKQSQSLKNLPKIGIFGLKRNHLATLVQNGSVRFSVFLDEEKILFWHNNICTSRRKEVHTCICMYVGAYAIRSTCMHMYVGT